MFSKKMLRSAISVLGVLFAVSICIGLSGNIAIAEDPPEFPDLCENNSEFTTEFRLQDCRYFKTIGKNPYFKLIPGYKLVLEGEEEKSVETVLWDTKWIDLSSQGLGWIKTRVLEERAYEMEDGEETLVEISRNWFAICAKTNAVYYFGEWSRDCPNGFDENDVCEGEESNEGSWEAGVDGARPGLMMTGTPLLGSKYFQEIAPPDAVDRGQIVEMGLTWPLEEDLEEGEVPEFRDCIKIIDTNPAEGDCDLTGEDADTKIYCPGVGLVQDQDLELVEYGYKRYPPWCRYR
jgi:hypothetical protein